MLKYIKVKVVNIAKNLLEDFSCFQIKNTKGRYDIKYK